MIRWLAAISIVLVLGLAVAACGDDEDDGNNLEIAPTATASSVSEGDSEVPSGEGPPPVSAEPTVLDDGLQIIEVQVGDGEEAGQTATVTVHYTGWLDDGTVFDSSVERGTPATFPLSGVIAGWQEGIPGMKVGGTRRLIIPPELAYGEAGRPSIPPNSTLTFDVELLSIDAQ